MTAAQWRLLLRRAEQCDAEAQWEVAERHFDGCKDQSGRILVNRSFRKGFEWLQRSGGLRQGPPQGFGLAEEGFPWNRQLCCH